MREPAAAVIKRFASLLAARRVGRLRAIKMPYERTAKEVSAKNLGFMKET